MLRSRSVVCGRDAEAFNRFFVYEYSSLRHHYALELGCYDVPEHKNSDAIEQQRAEGGARSIYSYLVPVAVYTVPVDYAVPV